MVTHILRPIGQTIIKKLKAAIVSKILCTFGVSKHYLRVMNKNILFVLLLAVASVLPAAAQVRLGVRGGVTLGELRFDRDVINSDNRMGYTAGLLVDLNIPVVGLGIEASAMYTHRNDRYRLSDDYQVFKRHYFDIPVYARYRLSLSGIGHVFAPYIFTGPCFSVLFGEDTPANHENSKTVLSWDVGAGADLFNHLRLSATYGLGISKAMDYIDREYTGDHVHGKDKHWTVSAAWLF